MRFGVWTGRQSEALRLAAVALGSHGEFTVAELALLALASGLKAQPIACAMEIIREAILNRGFFSEKPKLAPKETE